MTTAPNSRDASAAPGGAAPKLPCYAGAQPFASVDEIEVPRGARSAAVRVSLVPALVQEKMVARAERCAERLRDVPTAEWLAIFGEAGRRIEADRDALARTAARVAASTGVPAGRAAKALSALARTLQAMRAVLAAQAPGGDVEAFRTGDAGGTWRWLPTGRHAAVRIPGNFPTINVTWLQALAMRRPVILAASLADPFTPLLLVEALYAAGLPDGAASLGYGDLPHAFARSDAVFWHGTLERGFRTGQPVHVYHHGRSKVVLRDPHAVRDLWPRLAALAMQGCGRLCTNPRAVLVEHDAAGAAEHLAQALSSYTADPPAPGVASFPDAAQAARIAAEVARAVQRGAVDVSLRVTGRPLLETRGDGAVLRPAVLLMDASDPLFGAELPFGFVCVAAVPRAEIAQRCRASLIVSVVGDDELARQLVREPDIDKVFTGEHFDRGYVATDPHEGFIAGHLFKAKAFR